ncbi:MAG TPA: carbonic anhydrase [Planctomycetota bacterium]
MDYLPQLFENNRRWATAQVAADPEFFGRLCGIQQPEHLWIGCSDSRVPANQIIGLKPGEVFVHRNVANLVYPEDPNCGAVVQFAVDTLRVQHIIVCGHYGCGGVLAALRGGALPPPLGEWLTRARAVRDAHRGTLAELPDEEARWHRLCELNVLAQVEAVAALPVVRAAWERGQSLDVHGWIYDLHDGLLHDLGVTVGST